MQERQIKNKQEHISDVVSNLKSMRDGENDTLGLFLKEAIDLLKEYSGLLVGETPNFETFPPFEPCCVADQHCEAPANQDDDGDAVSAKYECYHCGLPVCSKCSSIRTIRMNRNHNGAFKARLCNNCQVEHDGHNRIVMRRIRRLAGYKS